MTGKKSQKLDFLGKFDDFLKILKEQLILGKITQQEYLSILIEKVKSMQKLENIGKRK